MLYAITTEDVMTVSRENKIPFSEQDLYFIADKIGNFFGGRWYAAVEYALEELKRSKQSLWRYRKNIEVSL